MKRTILLILCVFTLLNLFAQSKTEEIIIGNNLLSGKDILAIKHTFPEEIYKYYFNPASNHVTLQLKRKKLNRTHNNAGIMMLYDLKNKHTKWSKNINSQGDSYIQFNDIIVNSKKNGFALDYQTGEKKWKVKNNIYYANTKYNIGIGYHFSKNNLLQGIDLNNGNVIWEREINQEYGWNDFTFLNDSTALISAAGLHSIDIQNGDGWDLDAVTGKKDYKAANIANAAGILAGILTGTFILNDGHDLIHCLTSNTFIEKQNIYFADIESLICIDIEGNIKWENIFDEGLTSKSHLFTRKDTLFMVNLGYVYKDARKIDYGIPFIAAFDKETGDIFYYKEIAKKKDAIVEVLTEDNSAIVLYEDRIARYSLKDGMLLSEKSINFKEYGRSLKSINIFNYIKNGSHYESLVLQNPENIYFMNNEAILEFNPDLNLNREISFDDIYFLYKKTNNCAFLEKGNQTIVIDNNNKEIGKLNVSESIFISGNILYAIEDNSLFEIDLSEFM